MANDLANPPAEASPLHLDPAVITRLADALEQLTNQPAAHPVDPDLKVYPPEDVAGFLNKTKNWVVEAMRDGRIPFTEIGQTRGLTAKQIRQVIADGERKPNKFSRLAHAA